jgi:purine-nucleoside/S-methyl-5'-thioadenosine phosphorylase / adenosine deaminase
MSESGSTPLIKLEPRWPAPNNIVAFTTCRVGGVSEPPFESLNLGLHVGDERHAVAVNRDRLSNSCVGLNSIQWLNQVHGDCVIEVPDSGVPDADACYTRQSGLGCAVMTADCLPILICDGSGQQVAAAHAGWRSLVAGIIEKTVVTFAAESDQLLVWLGPAIGKDHFEVGSEVRQKFIDAAAHETQSETNAAFYPSPERPGYYYADLCQLARIRLKTVGVKQIFGGKYCCYSDSQRFFSYRRDHTTGRMVSLIYKRA